MSPSPTSAIERLVRWQPRFELCAVCRQPTRGFGWSRAAACEPAAALSVVLLHHLSGLLLATGAEIFRHG